MILPVLLSVALAAPPDKVAARVSVGGGEVGRLQGASDGGLVTGVTSKGHLVVLDTSSWEGGRADTTDANVAPAACTARSAVPVPDDALGWLVYVGCSNGTVQTWRWTGTALGPYGNDASPEGLVADVADAGVVALFDVDGDGLWGLVSASGGLQPIRLLTASGVVSSDLSAVLPVGMPSGFDEAVLHPIRSGPIVTIHHGDGRVTQWAPKTGSLAAPVPLGNVPEPTDITSSDSAVVYYVERGAGRLGQLVIQGGVVNYTTFGAEVGVPRTVLFAQDDEANYFYVEDAAQLKVFPSSATGEPSSQFGVGYDGVDMIAGPTGYTIAGTTDGDFAVLTARPWVSDLVLSPARVATGDSVVVTFTSDEAGSWSLDADGTRTQPGSSIASGSLEAEGDAEVSFEVGDDLGEGTHTVWARITGKDGEVGVARATLVVDNVPTDIRLDAGDVGVGNRQVVLSWSRLTDEDLTGYNVYLSEAPFDAADFPTAGPSGDVGKVTSPVFVEQPASGTTVRAVIDRLVNGRTYWLAVRATDGTNEGPMSNVVSATPVSTCSAAECAGEPGGPPCSTLPGVAAGWGLALLAAGAVRRRRGAAALAAVGFLSVLPGEARAQATSGVFAKDETPAWSNFELQFAGFQYADGVLTSAYGTSGTTMRLEAGVQLFRYAEIDVGVGYTWDRGNTLGPGNVPTAEESRTEWLPLTLTGTARVHVVDEQPLVPFASIGFSYIFWREAPLDTEGAYRDNQMVVGSKLGWHWGVGGNLLLDVFQPRRAAMLEARTGINDTWLVVEYRQQRLDAAGGLDLSGWSIGGGLKIDY